VTEVSIFLCGAAAGAFALWAAAAISVRAILSRGQKLVLVPWGPDAPPQPPAAGGPEEPDYDDPDWWKKS
jgi:hypothetical protein